MPSSPTTTPWSRLHNHAVVTSRPRRRRGSAMNAMPLLTDTRSRPSHVSIADSVGTGTTAVTTHGVVISSILRQQHGPPPLHPVNCQVNYKAAYHRLSHAVVSATPSSRPRRRLGHAVSRPRRRLARPRRRIGSSSDTPSSRPCRRRYHVAVAATMSPSPRPTLLA
jgi:hypothetical protein